MLFLVEGRFGYMTQKELKKLNRKQLLELLLEQTKRADNLQKELDEARELLKTRDIEKMRAGSIAEAALKLNGVFEAAETAAAQYLENVIRLAESAEAVKAARKLEQDGGLTDAE